jgi:hypothetical protein
MITEPEALHSEPVITMPAETIGTSTLCQLRIQLIAMAAQSGSDEHTGSVGHRLPMSSPVAVSMMRPVSVLVSVAAARLRAPSASA